MGRKRTRQDPTEDDGEDDDEEDGSNSSRNIAISGELASFAEARGIAKKKRALRMRTITTSVDACLRRDMSSRPQILKSIEDWSIALGTLRSIATVYLNVLADHNPSPAVPVVIFEFWFVRQVFLRLAGLEMRSDAETRFNDPNLAAIKDHFQHFILHHPLPASLLDTVSNFPRRMCDYVCNSVMNANKAHVSDHFSSRADGYFRHILDKKLLQNGITSSTYKSDLQKASFIVRKCCCTTRLDYIESTVSGFCAENLQDWKMIILVTVFDHRDMFQTLRNPPPPPKKPSKKKHRVVEDKNGLRNFSYQSKANHAALLKILRTFRECCFEMQNEKAEIVREIETLTRNSTNAEETRKNLWQNRKSPGMETLPKQTTLLTKSPIAHAFVTYDQVIISQMLAEVAPAEEHDGSSFWWSALFDFYSGKTIHRKPSKKKSRKLKRRRRRQVLKQRRRLRTGISLCYKTPSVADPRSYENLKRSKTAVIPWLVNSIMSDGLQVKVTLATVESNSSPHVCQTSLPAGVATLVKKGYTGISGTYDCRRDKKGLYAKAKALPKSYDGDPIDLEVIGLDPGQVEISTCVRANHSLPLQSDAVAPPPLSTGRSFSSKLYRHLSLARASELYEKRRCVGDYKEAVEKLSAVSLKVHGKSSDYARVFHESLEIMQTELTRPERRIQRFARFRARQRTMHYMATDIAFGGYQGELAQLRGRAKREARRDLYSRRRVVFFGNAQFGHGARRPCPRKSLLRALGLLYPVVLMDEFCTSKKCHGCGNDLVQNSRYRVFRCTRSQTGGSSCTVKFIDRDVNGSCNIFMCGLHMLLGKARPRDLQRQSRSR